MSGKREKLKRADQRYEEYCRQLEKWRYSEPPRIFFISWRRWRKREPKIRKEATR